jgi:hypothetical protein
MLSANQSCQGKIVSACSMHANSAKLRNTFIHLKKTIDVRSKNTSCAIDVSGGDMLYLLQIHLKQS